MTQVILECSKPRIPGNEREDKIRMDNIVLSISDTLDKALESDRESSDPDDNSGDNPAEVSDATLMVQPNKVYLASGHSKLSRFIRVKQRRKTKKKIICR